MPENLEKFQSGHLPAAAIRALADGLLTPDDALPLLEHLEACPACMDAYIAALAETELQETPEELTGRVLAAVERENKTEKKTVLVVFPAVAKLMAALALTMVLFFTGVFDAIGHGARDLVDTISTSSSARPEDSGQLARWSEALDTGIQKLVEQWNAIFVRR